MASPRANLPTTLLKHIVSKKIDEQAVNAEINAFFEANSKQKDAEPNFEALQFIDIMATIAHETRISHPEKTHAVLSLMWVKWRDRFNEKSFDSFRERFKTFSPQSNLSRYRTDLEIFLHCEEDKNTPVPNKLPNFDKSSLVKSVLVGLVIGVGLGITLALGGFATAPYVAAVAAAVTAPTLAPWIATCIGAGIVLACTAITSAVNMIYQALRGRVIESNPPPKKTMLSSHAFLVQQGMSVEINNKPTIVPVVRRPEAKSTDDWGIKHVNNPVLSQGRQRRNSC